MARRPPRLHRAAELLPRLLGPLIPGLWALDLGPWTLDLGLLDALAFSRNDSEDTRKETKETKNRLAWNVGSAHSQLLTERFPPLGPTTVGPNSISSLSFLSSVNP